MIVFAAETITLERKALLPIFLNLEGDLIASRELEIQVPPQIWAKIDTMVEEGKEVKTDEIVVTLNAADMMQRLDGMSVEVVNFQLDTEKTRADKDVELCKSKGMLEAGQYGLEVQQLSFDLTRAGADTREIRKNELDVSSLDLQIRYTKDKNSLENILRERGFFSVLEYKNDLITLDGLEIDQEIQQIDLKLLRSTPSKFGLFKARCQLEEQESNLEQLKREQSFKEKQKTVEENSQNVQLDRLSRRRDQMAERLQKCQLKAPCSGIFLHPETGWNGDLVPGAQVWSSESVGSVIDPADLLIRCQVLERDIEKVALDQTAEININKQHFSGKIIYISKLAMPLIPGIKAYELKIMPDSRINALPNQKVDLRISVKTLSNVFEIPVDLTCRQEENEGLKLDGGKFSRLIKEKIVFRDFDYIYYQDGSLPKKLSIIAD
ncbi:MAG: hypothetical protein PHW04_05975 [Candidatus Wallbacteria bacterium]|nr:hypothetical protein [Candidatus Wallbacteria bacterium]